jgi:tRNA nucleotidyltransferase (CCA-adding enzyme)
VTTSHPDPARFPLTAEVFALGEAIGKAGGRPVLVGGWVRDCLLDIPHSKDFDLEVFGMSPNRLRTVLATFGAVHAVGRHFGVLKLVTHGQEFDVSVPRRESKTGRGHRGFWVEPDPSMTFDQAAARRDFTINTMGYAFLEHGFLNPYRGWEHLEARQLRHVGPAFGEDPLRVLRAMQFAGRFGLTIVPETLAICREQDLHELARERIWEEVKKLMLRAPVPSRGWHYAEELGVFKILPELGRLQALDTAPGHGPWSRALAAVDAAVRLTGPHGAERLQLCLAALCHELGRTLPGQAQAGFDAALAAAAAGPTQSLLARLTNEQDITKAVTGLIQALPLVGALWERREAQPAAEIRRLALRVRLKPLLQLAQVRHLAERAPAAGAESPAVAWLRGEAARLGVLEQPPEPLLKGRHLLELGFRQGPEMGEVLQRAFERQLEGEFTTLDEALQWLRRTVTLPQSTDGAAS